MRIQRIAYVLHIFPKLSETFVAGEMAELRRRGIELRILSLLPPREELQHEIIRRAGLVEITSYEVSQFANVIRKFKPQLLHAHFATEATAKARELSAECGVPFTFTAHGYDIHRKPPSDFRERALTARAVVTVSEANADYISQTFDVPAAHLRVIPCGVDTEEFRPATERDRSPVAAGGETLAHGEFLSPPRSAAAAGGDRPRSEPPWIVCVARHVKVKNLDLLLGACAELNRRGVGFRCALIGDGPFHQDLKSKREELGLECIVEMPGALDQREVLQWWQRAAVGVLSSEHEGMPVCLMEAAACGVPVVAPAVGGIPELVLDGVTGLLTQPNDRNSLVAALERLLGDANLRTRMGIAARLRAEEKFSVRRQVDQLLALWETTLQAARPNQSQTEVRASASRRILVSDPFNSATDPALPTVAAALDPVRARAGLKRQLPRLAGEDGVLKLAAIRVIRHKPGKRCVIEYDVRRIIGGEKAAKVTLIGKIRARRSGNEGYRQQEMVWNAGFDANSADGISVPEPLGVLSEFKMWCQRKVAGEVATKLLAGPKGVAVVRRIAEAIHKLHQANLPTEKTHTMADELRILRECFAKTAAMRPEWTGRIAKLQLACEGLGARVPGPKACGIHRDFYSAQVIVERGLQPAASLKQPEVSSIHRDNDCARGSGVNDALPGRLWLLDFDLFCLGDPGLDVGNFIGHVTEQALREHGDASALDEVESAMEERFVDLSGEAVRPAVRAYTTLTLARHVYLSTQFPERQHTTESLLELCEQRLA